jgi:hypothetical protein
LLCREVPAPVRVLLATVTASGREGQVSDLLHPGTSGNLCHQNCGM